MDTDSAASPRSFEPAPPQPPDGKTPPRPRSEKSDNLDSAAIEAEFGSTAPNEREERHSAAQDHPTQRRIWESRCPALLAERDCYRAALERIISEDSQADWYYADIAREALKDA